MKNDCLSDGIPRSMELLAKTTRPYQEAVNILKQHAELFAALSNPLVSNLGVINTALMRGVFDKSLAQSVSGLLAPYRELTSARTAIKALGSSLAGMIKPEVYSSAGILAATNAKLACPYVVIRQYSLLLSHYTVPHRL